MGKERNVFISHHGKDDDYVQRLKSRLTNLGYTIKNSSIDSTKPNRKTSDDAIGRLLRLRIRWSGLFICIVGKETHERKWVNDEIKWAHEQGKRIVGIYAHGASDANLPENLKKYRSGSMLGWNSLDKLADALDGKNFTPENPDSSFSAPLFSITRIKCR